MTKKKEQPAVEPPTLTEAAEYLWSIFDEFHARSDAALIAMRRARVLLDVCVDQGMKAIEANAVAARTKKGGE